MNMHQNRVAKVIHLLGPSILLPLPKKPKKTDLPYNGSNYQLCCYVDGIDIVISSLVLLVLLIHEPIKL